MSYVKINGRNTKYHVSFEPFTTQHGYEGVRFIGEEIPENNRGFKVYNDDDEEMFDLSKYKYIYRQNEYSVEHDDIEQPIGNNEPTASGSSLDGIYGRLNQLSAEIENITPYVAEKTAYIDDEYVEFDLAKDGNISIYMVDGEGQNVPFTFERINGKVRVSFEKRSSLATVTMSIQ